jgi:hypothetical protein
VTQIPLATARNAQPTSYSPSRPVLQYTARLHRPASCPGSPLQRFLGGEREREEREEEDERDEEERLRLLPLLLELELRPRLTGERPPCTQHRHVPAAGQCSTRQAHCDGYIYTRGHPHEVAEC